jgi:hypothetical protein
MTMQQRTILIAAAAAIVAFGIGAFWQYTSARSYADRLAESEREYVFQRLEATLGAATIEAQRGGYEIARQLASEFFSGLQQNIHRAGPQQRPIFQEILAQRDAMITALSRSDPQTGSLLAQLFIRFRIARGEPVGPEDATQSTPPTSPE